MSLDTKDIAILRTIADAETGSPDEIHEHTGIPTSTVHYRLKRLRDEGVLENDLFDVNRDALGLSLTVISEVDAEYEEGFHESVGEHLADVDGVKQVYFVMGDTDFVVISHLPDRDKVENLIASFEAIEAVIRSSSKFVISAVEEHSSVVGCYSEESLRDTLGLPADVSVSADDADGRPDEEESETRA